MKRIVPMMFAALLAANFLSAQSVADGIKLLNYEKNNSAVATLKKAYDANPKDPQTIYWYGQALRETEGVKAAKALYQKALQDGVNDAWVIVGMGHIDILEGNSLDAAKQKFEQAITMTTETKGKNKGKPSAGILNAIGRANADSSSKMGDQLYAIDKLKQAGAIDLTNADIFLNMGINYMKMGGEQGGEAVKAFLEAATRNPKDARAYYRIGNIYASQNNKELLDENYEKAIAADPNFPNVYLALYRYYSNRDVNKAKDDIEKYVALADKSCDNDYYVADYLFRAGKNQESIAKADEMKAGNCKDFARLNILYAYNYDRLNDSVKAKASLDQFFAKATKFEPSDYELAVKVFSKFPGEEKRTAGYLETAIANDTNKQNQLAYINQAANMFGNAKMYGEQLKWLQKAATYKTSLGEFDYYKLASTAYSAKDYVATMAIAKDYINAFPDKPQGYTYNVNAAKALDSTTNPGIGVEAINLQNGFFAKDLDKYKKSIFRNNYYLLIYYGEKVKDNVKAIEVCDKLLVLYPDAGEEHDFAVKTKAVLQKAMSSPSTQGKTPASKPSGN